MMTSSTQNGARGAREREKPEIRRKRKYQLKKLGKKLGKELKRKKMNGFVGSFRFLRLGASSSWRAKGIFPRQFYFSDPHSNFSQKRFCITRRQFVPYSTIPNHKFHFQSVSVSKPFSSIRRYSSSPFLTPPLNSIVKLELLEKESSERIEEIWIEFFKDKANLSAVVPAPTYQHLKARFEHCPIFFLPWEQTSGRYVPVFFSVKGNTHCYTLASDMKNNPDSCPPQMVVHYFTDLYDTKNVVLMKGDLVGPTFSAMDGQFLAGLTQIFYLNDEWYEKYVLPCNYDHDKFSFEDVVQLLFNFQNTSEDEEERNEGEEETEIMLSSEDLMRLDKHRKETESNDEKKHEEEDKKTSSNGKKETSKHSSKS